MPGSARLSPWAGLVAGCSAVLVVVFAAVGVLRLATDHERRVSFQVRGEPAGLQLDADGATVEVVGGGRRVALVVERREHYAFGHPPTVARSVRDGVVVVRSHCPRVLLHDCTIRYRVTVPDNVPLVVRTGSGDVRFRGYRGSAEIETGSGSVRLEEFCGFSLQVRTGSGDVDAETACALQQLGLRTTTGAITAHVPGGRYRIDAGTGAGRPVLRGLTAATDSPFAIQALSGTGAVTVERRP